MSAFHRWTRLFAAAGIIAAGTALAARPPAAQAAPIPATDYQQVQLAVGGAELGEAMSLAVLPNRSVVHTARDGTVRVTDAAGNTKMAGRLAVVHARRGRPAGRRGRPELRHQPVHLPLLLARAEHPRRGRPGHRHRRRLSRPGRGI